MPASLLLKLCRAQLQRDPQCLCLLCSLLPLRGRAQHQLMSRRCLLKSDHTTEPMPNAVPFAYEWPLQNQQDHSERLKLSVWVSIFSVCLPLLKMAMLICVLKCGEREAPPTPRATHKNILNSKGSRTCQSCCPCTAQTSVKISCFCEQILQRAEFDSKSFREYFRFPSCAFLLYVFNCPWCIYMYKKRSTNLIKCVNNRRGQA